MVIDTMKHTKPPASHPDEHKKSAKCVVSLVPSLNMLLPRGSAHRKDNSNQIQRLISCLDSPTLHDTRDTKIAQAHFTCICSIAELKGENERVPCMMKLVPLLFKACTNVALSSCNSSDCIRMLLKHLQRLVKNADTDLRTIMCNQRSRIIKQVGIHIQILTPKEIFRQK